MKTTKEVSHAGTGDHERKAKEIAQMMVAQDCGDIPVCDASGKPIGVTDRDIVCRLVAKGKEPTKAMAQDCMSKAVVTVRPDAPIEEAATLMEQYQVRRLPVVEQSGRCCGVSIGGQPG